MQRLPSIPAVLIALILCPTAAVRAAFSQVAEGTVTGHVYCDDTNGPARMARVTLEPVKDVRNATQPHYSIDLSSTNSIQTGLDGSFAMTHVKPGTYYVIAEMPGYLSPLADLSAEEWVHPTAPVADRMAKMAQTVQVQAGRTATVNIGLERGAAVSGTISFDDGSPAADVRIHALKEKSDGSWGTVRLSAVSWSFGNMTDDLGHYRIAGLTTGHYLIEADMSLSEITVKGFLGSVGSVDAREQYSLSIFTGNSTSKSADNAFALRAGESRTDEDIVIPLSKLHSVSGTVIAARDGHPLTAGQVSLLYGDDKRSLATAAMDQSSGEYRFYFVPEGHYILSVVGASDLTQASGGTAPKNVYGQLQQPLDISGDIDGLVLSVPDATAAPAVSQNSNKVQ